MRSQNAAVHHERHLRRQHALGSGNAQHPEAAFSGDLEGARLGLAADGTARIATTAGEAELAVRVSPHLAPGVAFVPFNNPGLRANTLLSGGLVTVATVAPVGAPVSVGGEA